MRYCAVLLSTLAVAQALEIHAAVLRNHDFETGDLSDWVICPDQMSIAASTNQTFNRNFSARIGGEYSGSEWVTNTLSQRIPLASNDWIEVLGFVNWTTLSNDIAAAGACAEVHARLDTPAGPANAVWSEPHGGWRFFRICAPFQGIFNGGFENGTLSPWRSIDDQLKSELSSDHAQGNHSLRIHGSWTNWNLTQVYQPVSLGTGNVVEISARLHISELRKGEADWVVAGIKLESADFTSSFEASIAHASETSMTNKDFMVSANCVITNGGRYVLYAMVCGGREGSESSADVYFDDIRIRQPHEQPEPLEAVLSLGFSGHSGGAAYTSSGEVYFDTIIMRGSNADPETPGHVFDRIASEAAALALNDDEHDIPELLYPPLNSYGYIEGDTNDVHFPSRIELGIAGWRFRYMTNDVTLAITNTYELYELEGAGYGRVEIDQLIYCARYWAQERGEPLRFATNAPYFTIGVEDGSGAEFGEGGFDAIHTYIVGQPLSQFPRCLDTAGDRGWPRILHVVFEENLSEFDRAWDKHFVLSTVPGNPSDNIKAMTMSLECTDPGHTNLEHNSQEIHMGWSQPSASQGMVDYPNCTYQDHNEVFLRASWLNGLLDQDGWFMAQAPRGSATIEPMDLFVWQDGNWIPKAYEEYLFAWANAGSGVRSLFDDDDQDRIPGPASYHVGLKIGHENGVNELGEPKYPQVIEVRGNGYLRMTDYDGVMGGSFRPVSMDIFGIHQYREDAPLMPEAYCRWAPPTSSEIDNSHIEITMPVRSKTNQWLTGVTRMAAHFAPEEVNETGAYFDMQTDIYANRAIVRDEHGPLNAFAQVDMFWRGSDSVDEHLEGHDFDAIVVKKTDGEWITHRPINPPTNIYHRTLSSFRQGDAVYIMQQDRGPQSYGFSTEAPYRKVSTFEITLLDDGGADMSMDVYEQNTISEINDNVVIACTINEDFDKGAHASFQYRYRSIYAPGVTIANPNTSDGGENWSNNVYTIEAYATDGEDKPLQMNLYYGNGLDDDWILINVGELLLVPEQTHLVKYDWNVSTVPPGAYYIKAEARRVAGGKTGFDVSDARLQVGNTFGFPNNCTTNISITTNQYRELGANMSFETGDVIGWASSGDHLDIYASTEHSYQGDYSAKMIGSWSGWSWNNLQQQIACVSGEMLRVTGRIFIKALATGSTDWIACGIKMESTNPVGRTWNGAEFDHTMTTGVWINIDFTRTAPVTGADKLLLWVAGNDCDHADIFFDDIHVLSTNNATIVTNRVRTGYWEADNPVDVSRHAVVSMEISGAPNCGVAQMWAADSAGTTNYVSLTNWTKHLVSTSRRVYVPWSAFPDVDTTALRAFGFLPDDAVSVSAARSHNRPFRVSAEHVASPAFDLEGLPHYNPGETVVQEITLQNDSGIALNGVRIQLLQEYGETLYWWDTSHEPHLWNVKTRRGDRLCGDFEHVWTNVSIAAGDSVVLTNCYTLPAGRLIDSTRFAIPSEHDWHIFRNMAARAQSRLVIRANNGDNLAEVEFDCYSLDDDFDIDNDGLPDAYETSLGGHRTEMEPNDDPDEDGIDNLTEFLNGTHPSNPDTDDDRMSDGAEIYAGTDPMSPLSHLALDGRQSTVDADTLTLSWPSASNRTYSLYCGTNLQCAFVNIASGLPATPPTNAYTTDITNSLIFYRIRVE